MRTIAWSSIFLLILAFSPSHTSAHLSGPPFVKINGSFTEPYPVQISSDPDLKLPQEMSPVRAVVGEEVQFSLDSKALSMSLTFPEGTRFLWDFGDGEADEGTAVAHVYNAAKSYKVDLYADDPVNDPIQIEDLLLHVVPSKEYVLPTATIAVEGKTTSDPSSQPIIVDLGKPVQFQATAKSGTAEIASYYWDFGDGTPGNGQDIGHSYPSAVGGSVAPLLRVTDRNGLFYDSYVWLKDDESAARDAALTKNDQKNTRLRTVVYPLLATLAGVALLYALARIIRQKNKQTG